MPIPQGDRKVNLICSMQVSSVRFKHPLKTAVSKSWHSSLSRCFPDLIHVLVSSAPLSELQGDCGLIRLICLIINVPEAAVSKMLP